MRPDLSWWICYSIDIGVTNRRKILGSMQCNMGDTSIRATSTGVLIVFFRQLRLPVLLFVAFIFLCVLAYSNLEGIKWQDALFWIFHPHGSMSTR